MIDLVVDNSEAYAPDIEGMPGLFICENAPLERLLFDRRQTGLSFVRTCREATVLFVRHLKSFLAPIHDDVSELMVFSKGYYYWLHSAYEIAFVWLYGRAHIKLARDNALLPGRRGGRLSADAGIKIRSAAARPLKASIALPGGGQ